MNATEPGKLKAPPRPTAGGTTMTALLQDRYGSAPEDLLRLAEIDRPDIGSDEVLVRVHAASVDRGTWHIMSGLPYPIRLAGSVCAARSTPTRAGIWPERSRRSAPT